MKKFKVFYQKWVLIARKVAVVQVKVLFTIVYFIFIIPFGLIFKLFSSKRKSGWQAVKQVEETLNSARRQF